MKQVVLALILCVSYLALNAQDYQTIRSNQQNYFGVSGLSKILATRTDSIELQGSDSIFYSFETMRQNDSTISYTCDYIKTYNWYGAKVIIKDNGENLFFNKDLDTISFNTQAALNDTFLIYTYPNGYEIQGYISKHDTTTILGVLDSVKTIKLFSPDTLLALHDSTIQIGKQLGFIQAIPFYSFPESYFENTSVYTVSLIGTEYPRQGITKRKIKEIYDFSIGDVIHWSRTTTHWSGGPYDETSYRKMVITNTDQWGNDSLKYNYDLSWINTTWYNGIVNTTSNSGSSTRTEYNLDQYLNAYLPEELYVDSSNINPNFYQNQMKIRSCGLISEAIQIMFVYPPTDSLGNEIPGNTCYFSPGFGIAEPMPSEYIEGAGGPYQLTGETYSSGMGQSHWGALTYVKKSGWECGTEWFLEIDENSENPFKIYPNPATDFIMVKLREDTNGGNVIIYDISGKVCKSQPIFSQTNQIDISQLPSGIYLITIETIDRSFQEKLVIR